MSELRQKAPVASFCKVCGWQGPTRHSRPLATWDAQIHALTHYTRELEEAESSQTRSELHLVGEAEMLDVLYVEAGLEAFEVLLEREAGL